MNLPQKAIQELQTILERDYGQSINAEQANEFGVSLLRLTKVAVAVLARKNTKSDQT